MLRLFAMTVMGVAVVMVVSCRPGEDSGETGSAESQTAASEPVAKIGDYVITKGQLKERLAQEVRPQRDHYGPPKPPATPEAVLRKMVAEKALALEGRKLDYLSDEQLSSSLRQFRQRQLIRLFLTDYVMENVPVTESEIGQALKTDPNLGAEQAEMRIRSSKASVVLEQYYERLLETFKLEKVRENFAQASRIHQRLQTKPVEPRGRGVFWITNKQMRNELSAEEKQMVLARFTGGQVTLYDWFEALGQMAPPGRPKNLNTPEGVEGLLDRALKPVIWAAEAIARGYDKNEQFLQQVQVREDMMLLGKIRGEKYKEVEAPSDEQVKAYFEAHPEQFAKSASLKIQQIWCADLDTAQKVKQMVTDGASFESANTAHGLRKNESAHSVYPTSEGVFWADLWKAEPNAIVGPVKGFYETGICWRVVQAIAKTAAEIQPYSDNVANQVRSALMAERRDEIMAAYEAQLLQKYRHQMYTDRIEDIDPLAVSPVEKPGK